MVTPRISPSDYEVGVYDIFYECEDGKDAPHPNTVHINNLDALEKAVGQIRVLDAARKAGKKTAGYVVRDEMAYWIGRFATLDEAKRFRDEYVKHNEGSSTVDVTIYRVVRKVK